MKIQTPTDKSIKLESYKWTIQQKCHRVTKTRENPFIPDAAWLSLRTKHETQSQPGELFATTCPQWHGTRQSLHGHKVSDANAGSLQWPPGAGERFSATSIWHFMQDHRARECQGTGKNQPETGEAHGASRGSPAADVPLMTVYF